MGDPCQCPHCGGPLAADGVLQGRCPRCLLDAGASETVSLDAEREPPPDEPNPPRSLSGYAILETLGSGGMGRVFLAKDEGLGRKIAIKTLNPRLAQNATIRARFMQEARALARLTHPNIVRIYELGPSEEEPHFVMEYVEGVALTEAALPLDFRQRAELMRKVLGGVACLHQNGIVHRDLKPANILVGLDREPRLLDFGLAMDLEAEASRLTLSGELVGTPAFFSPEQARGAERLDARSDIFSLGAIFYAILTGVLPFTSEAIGDQLAEIRERDPALPRRLDRRVPGELQNIAMKALEKDPAARYQTAREMSADLERYLAGEPVLAEPPAYARMMRSGVSQHLAEIESWRHDQMISEAEMEALRRPYERLIERADAWILQARRLSFSQVTLYLGAWVLIVGAALLVLFRYGAISGARAAGLAVAPLALTGWIGLRLWKHEEYRIAVAYLLAFCWLLPVALLVAAGEWGWLTAFTRGDQDLELFTLFPSFRLTTNAQLWWAVALSMPAFYWLRRFTQAPVFSLVLSSATALLCLITLLRMGLLEWVDSDPGQFYLDLLPCGVIFLCAARILEWRRLESDSRYFYPLFVAFTLAGFSGLAVFHQPWADWLAKAAPWTRGQQAYLFLLNAAAYFALQLLLGRFRSAQLHGIAKAFRFMLPGHVLGSLLALGIAARDDQRLSEARLFEILLPLAATSFVVGSVSKQMKNFFLTGLLFLTIGIVRLQQHLMEDRALWPASLLVLGLLLMLAAANYTRLRLWLRRWSLTR